MGRRPNVAAYPSVLREIALDAGRARSSDGLAHRLQERRVLLEAPRQDVPSEIRVPLLVTRDPPQHLRDRGILRALARHARGVRRRPLSEASVDRRLDRHAPQPRRLRLAHPRHGHLRERSRRHRLASVRARQREAVARMRHLVERRLVRPLQERRRRAERDEVQRQRSERRDRRVLERCIRTPCLRELSPERPREILHRR